MSSNKSQTASNNIYDIICYYEDNDDEPRHVSQVINKIERTNSRKEREKWVKLKLFGCMLINVLLSAPIYSYGTIYLEQKDFFDAQPALIWPPIIFNSVYLLVTPWLFNSISTPSSRNSRDDHIDSSLLRNLTTRNVIIIFGLILSIGISISGVAFAYLNANIFVILVFYSVIGGMTSCIIMGKLFVLINGILNNDRMHLINFIYSFGQALSQVLFPLLTKFLGIYFCFNCTLFVVGAFMLHIIPITMLVSKNKISIHLPENFLRHKPDVVKPIEESRYSDISAVSFDFPADIKYPSDVFGLESSWKNPSCEDANGNLKSDNFLEDLDSHRIMNAEGVEILQTILEDDEEAAEIKFPETVVIEDNELSNEAVESIYEEINRKFEQQQQDMPDSCKLVRGIALNKFRNFSTSIHRQILNPLKRSLKTFKFYPSVILKSCDIFSYLLFITIILPNLTIQQYHLDDRRKVVYLISMMGVLWVAYAGLVAKFNNRLKHNWIQYFHILGLLGKFFGYLFTNQRYSVNSFIFGIILISLGHANSFQLQEIMIRNCFHPRKWFYVRGSIYSFSGLLVIIYSVVFHFIYVKFSFVTFCNIFVLFNLCGILVWLLTHYKSIIYVFSRY